MGGEGISGGGGRVRVNMGWSLGTKEEKSIKTMKRQGMSGDDGVKEGRTKMLGEQGVSGWWGRGRDVCEEMGEKGRARWRG